MIEVGQHAIPHRTDRGETERLRAVLPRAGTGLHPGAHTARADHHQIHTAIAVQIPGEHRLDAAIGRHRVRSIQHEALRRRSQDGVGLVAHECTRDDQIERAVVIQVDRAHAGPASGAPRSALPGCQRDRLGRGQHRPARRLRHRRRRHDAHAHRTHARVLELGERAARVHRQAVEELHRSLGGCFVARARGHALDAQLRTAQERIKLGGAAVPGQRIAIGAGQLKALPHVETRVRITGHGIGTAPKVLERLLRPAQIELTQADAVGRRAPGVHARSVVGAKDRAELLDRAFLGTVHRLVHERDGSVGQTPPVAVHLGTALELQAGGLEVELPHEPQTMVECPELHGAQRLIGSRGTRARGREQRKHDGGDDGPDGCGERPQGCGRRHDGACDLHAVLRAAEPGAPCTVLGATPHEARHRSSRFACAMRSFVESIEIAPVPAGARYGCCMYGCAVVRRCARMS